MSTIVNGKVKWVHPEKPYGFIEDEWGQEIFFHVSNGRDCMIEKGELVFYKGKNFNNEFVWLQKPTEGDSVQFAVAKGSLGRPKAKPWTFEYKVSLAYLDDYHENQDCPGCGHKEYEHSGSECQHKGCHCGDEAYEYDQLNDTGGCSQEEPGGITDCW